MMQNKSATIAASRFSRPTRSVESVRDIAEQEAVTERFDRFDRRLLAAGLRTTIDTMTRYVDEDTLASSLGSVGDTASSSVALGGRTGVTRDRAQPSVES